MKPWITCMPQGEKVGVLKVRLYRPFAMRSVHRGAAGDV